jgi:hypothetical protein
MTLLEQRSANVDDVLVMADFISHSHQNTLKNRKVDFKLVWGSESSLDVVLNNIRSEDINGNNAGK